MPKITPIKWKTLVCVFEQIGFIKVRQSGSHLVMTKDKCHSPLVIPVHAKDLTQGIIKSNIRSAGITNKEYFDLLKNCK